MRSQPRRPVVVLVLLGAGLALAAPLGARAAPDGYTMLLASVASFAMSPAPLGRMPFDPINDFAPVTQAALVTSLLSVHPRPTTRGGTRWSGKRDCARTDSTRQVEP